MTGQFNRETWSVGRGGQEPLPTTPPVSPSTLHDSRPSLTIGMATYKDFDGVAFTLRALQIYQDLTDVELLVVDNYGCEETAKFCGKVGARYVLATDTQGSCAPRDRVFHEATGEAVLCLDCHVLLWPGAIARLKQFFEEIGDRGSWTGDRDPGSGKKITGRMPCVREASSPNPGPQIPDPESRLPGALDLLQGPLLHDNGKSVSTHLDAVWRGQMWGTWGTDPRGVDPEGEPFEIRANGLGLFACRKDAWPGFNPHFRGFGGGEGYIQEKIRQRGGKVWCVPWLRWWHRFSRPAGIPYRIRVEDKFRNYLIGHSELGLPLEPIVEHFATFLSRQTMAAITNEVAKLRAQQADQFAYRLWQETGAGDRGPRVGKKTGTGERDPGTGEEEMGVGVREESGDQGSGTGNREERTGGTGSASVFSSPDPGPRSSCPYRVNVTTGGAREFATCQLLQQITGAEESLCIVREDACRACMKTALPTAEAPNYVVASLALGIARKSGDTSLKARMAPFIPRAKSKAVKRPEPCFHLGAVVERNGTCQRCWKRQCDRLETVVEQRSHCEACEHYEPV